jgi:hypothetical protein
LKRGSARRLINPHSRSAPFDNGDRRPRLISWPRQKLVGQLVSGKSRLHNLPTDGGVRLGMVVSELHGQSARDMALIVRRGHKRSIVALAHRLLRTIFFMIKRREHYRGSATNYEVLSVQRNAPHWIKALTRFGFISAAA